MVEEQKEDHVFRALMEGMPIPSAVNDEAGNVIYLNSAFVQAYGYTQSDIPTVEVWWQLAYPDLTYRSQVREEWFSRLRHANESDGAFAPYEVEIRIKNGEMRTIITSASSISQTGSALHLVTLIDITERKRTELALKKSEEALSLALSGAEMSMWSVDLLSGEFSLSEHWFRMLGYENKAFDVTLNSWKKWVHEDDRRVLEKSLIAHLNGEAKNFHAEVRLKHQEGHWIWVQSRGKIVEWDKNGAASRVAGTNFDISDRKRLAIEGSKMLQKIEAMILNLGSLEPSREKDQTENQIALLTARQRKVLELVALGYTSAQISDQLCISQATVVTHRRNLMKNLQLHNAADITRFAIQHNLISG